MKKLIAKILHAGDLHKHYKDISSLKGYRENCLRVQDRLNKILREQGFTHFIHLGDWYNKGYINNLPQGLTDSMYDLETARAVNGNFYGVMGNHTRLELHTNPEVYISYGEGNSYGNLHDYSFGDFKKIVRVPNNLLIGNVQYVFLHNLGIEDKTLNYKWEKLPEAEVVILLTHSDYLLPKAVSGTFLNINERDVYSVVKGADFLITGHIHDARDDFYIGDTYCMCRGSLSNTSVPASRKLAVSRRLPVLEVYQDDVTGVYSHLWKNLEFSLGTENLRITKSSVEEGRKKLSLRGKTIENLADKSELSMDVRYANSGGLEYSSLMQFINVNGYTEVQKKALKHISSKPKDIMGLLELFRGVKSDEQLS